MNCQIEWLQGVAIGLNKIRNRKHGRQIISDLADIYVRFGGDILGGRSDFRQSAKTDREIFLLYLLENMKYRGIVEPFDISLCAVETLLVIWGAQTGARLSVDAGQGGRIE